MDNTIFIILECFAKFFYVFIPGMIFSVLLFKIKDKIEKRKDVNKTKIKSDV